MKNFLKSVKGKVAAAIVIISVLSLFTAATTNDDLFEISKNIDIYASIYKELNTYYVDDIDPNRIMRTGIDAMLESLDPYTNYYSEADMEGYAFQITGNYGGIGATIRPINGEQTVIETYEGYAADKAGLLPGDIIREIDGKSLKDKTDAGISDLLRGSPGTSVTMKVYRPFADMEFSVAITREDIDVKNVPYYGFVEDGVGYIVLTQFTEDAGMNVQNALKDLQKQNPQMKGVILDLRGNPGGLLREAVNVSNVFIDKGKEICSTRGKVKDWDKTFTAINNPVDSKIPLIVLTNSRSASASEIVSGVIQDYDRGVILGTKSFGKGLVQTTRDLSYKTKLKLTTAKYYIPSGRCIQALDYSHRNPDGSVGRVPDSLKTAFKTINSKRIVYDGGGIDPDVAIEPSTYKDITVSLLQKNLIFQYATKYKYEHPNIADARTFSLSDKEYEDFVSWLSDKDYDYSTETEKLLGDFEKSAKEDAYFDAVKSDIEDLHSKIGHDKKQDLTKFKEEIREELNDEIVSRYYGDKGRVENSFANDPDVMKSVYLFYHTDEYQKLLSPAK